MKFYDMIKTQITFNCFALRDRTLTLDTRVDVEGYRDIFTMQIGYQRKIPVMGLTSVLLAMLIRNEVMIISKDDKRKTKGDTAADRTPFVSYIATATATATGSPSGSTT